jgi:hypothetical protein
MTAKQRGLWGRLTRKAKPAPPPSPKRVTLASLPPFDAPLLIDEQPGRYSLNDAERDIHWYGDHVFLLLSPWGHSHDANQALYVVSMERVSYA